MSDVPPRPVFPGSESSRDDALESLLRLAGPREPVPADRLRRLKCAARVEWQQHTRARRQRRVMAWSVGGLAAAAAALLFALRLLLPSPDAGASAPRVATVEALPEAARLMVAAPGSADAVPLGVGDTVAAGATLSVSGSSVATIRLASGALLRLDGSTVLRLDASDTASLQRGAVYVSAEGDASLEVRTSLGAVRDVGTRFEVRLVPDGLRVRVREGLVQVRRDRAVHEARPGDELTVDPTGAVTRRAVPLDGPAWAWTTSRPQAFELEGRTLREFLEWIVAENGWQLRFSDAAVEDKASDTTLHGSIAGLSAAQALAAVLPTSGVAHRLQDGVLSISLALSAKD